MRSKGLMIVICGLFATLGAPARAQRDGAAVPQPQTAPGDDPVKTLVSRLDLETYKSTIKGLTQFGDRREGTDRNRAAIDWIEAQLKSYVCTNTERLHYDYQPRPRAEQGRGGNNAVTPDGQRGAASGGGRLRGIRARTGVNTDPNAQPDLRLRELDSQP